MRNLGKNGAKGPAPNNGAGAFDADFRSAQDALFEQLARIGKAVANKHRLQLLELLAQTGRTVEALAHEAALSTANTSQHLQQLRINGLVEATKSGLHMHYRLSCPEVLELLRAIRTIAEKRLGDLQRILDSFLADKDQLEPITNDELLQRLRKGNVVVLDVRPAEEYEAGHIPGAISIPLEELEKRLRELPARKEIVAYCRGPYCLLSHRALTLLKRAGHRARRLREGFPEWVAAGLPVES